MNLSDEAKVEGFFLGMDSFVNTDERSKNAMSGRELIGMDASGKALSSIRRYVTTRRYGFMNSP